MKIIVAMPAYNVAETLEQTFNALPEKLRQHIILGNNQSEDDTEAVAKKLGIQVMTHDRNYGYGGNLKRLYREARRQGGDIILEVHPDYQYEPSVGDLLVAYIERGHFDVIQANRHPEPARIAGGRDASLSLLRQPRTDDLREHLVRSDVRRMA